MERLPPGKTFTRNNWGFRLSDQLDLSSKHSHDYRQRLTRTMATLPVDQVGDAIYLRVEHQTLTRLPETQHTLFTIRTYHSSVREECRDVNRAHTMLSFLRGAPPELIEYKVMTPLFDALLVYLSRAAGQADRH